VDKLFISEMFILKISESIVFSIIVGNFVNVRKALLKYRYYVMAMILLYRFV